MAVSLVNAFLSYLVLFLVIVVLAGVAVTIGITLRKRNNRKLAEQDTVQTE